MGIPPPNPPMGQGLGFPWVMLGTPPPSPVFWGGSLSASPPPQMTIHNLYIFDRSGACLHYSEWHRRRQAGIPKEEVGGRGGRWGSGGGGVLGC